MYEWARFEVCAIRVFLVITACVGLNDMFRRRIIFVPQLENLLKITWNYTICHILSLVTLHSNIITCLTKWTALKLRCWAFIANATCHAKLHGNLWITFTVIVKKTIGLLSFGHKYTCKVTNWLQTASTSVSAALRERRRPIFTLQRRDATRRDATRCSRRRRRLIADFRDVPVTSLKLRRELTSRASHEEAGVMWIGRFLPTVELDITSQHSCGCLRSPVVDAARFSGHRRAKSFKIESDCEIHLA